MHFWLLIQTRAFMTGFVVQGHTHHTQTYMCIYTYIILRVKNWLWEIFWDAINIYFFTSKTFITFDNNVM